MTAARGTDAELTDVALLAIPVKNHPYSDVISKPSKVGYSTAQTTVHNISVILNNVSDSKEFSDYYQDLSLCQFHAFNIHSEKRINYSDLLHFSYIFAVETAISSSKSNV